MLRTARPTAAQLSYLSRVLWDFFEPEGREFSLVRGRRVRFRARALEHKTAQDSNHLRVHKTAISVIGRADYGLAPHIEGSVHYKNGAAGPSSNRDSNL